MGKSAHRPFKKIHPYGRTVSAAMSMGHTHKKMHKGGSCGGGGLVGMQLLTQKIATNKLSEDYHCIEENNDYTPPPHTQEKGCLL